MKITKITIKQAIKIKRAAKGLFLAVALFLAPAPFLTFQYVKNGQNMEREISKLKPELLSQWQELEKQEQQLWDEILAAERGVNHGLNAKGLATLERKKEAYIAYEVNRQERIKVLSQAPFKNKLYSFYKSIGVVA